MTCGQHIKPFSSKLVALALIASEIRFFSPTDGLTDGLTDGRKDGRTDGQGLIVSSGDADQENIL